MRRHRPGRGRVVVALVVGCVILGMWHVAGCRRCTTQPCIRPQVESPSSPDRRSAWIGKYEGYESVRHVYAVALRDDGVAEYTIRARSFTISNEPGTWRIADDGRSVIVEFPNESGSRHVARDGDHLLWPMRPGTSGPDPDTPRTIRLWPTEVVETIVVAPDAD